MFSTEQREYIIRHLRRPDNDLKIAEIAKSIAKTHKEYPSELVLDTAFIMNLGETHPDISFIYEPTRSFRDVLKYENEKTEIQESLERIRNRLQKAEELTGWDLNNLHGEFSVQMAKSIGINLTEEQEQVISGHSKGEYTSPLGQIIKIAEVCRATEQPRKFDGKEMPPASSWSEVENMLQKTKGLSPDMISIARESYGKQRFKELNKHHRDNNEVEID